VTTSLLQAHGGVFQKGALHVNSNKAIVLSEVVGTALFPEILACAAGENGWWQRRIL
jgi:hypothetical protein